MGKTYQRGQKEVTRSGGKILRHLGKGGLGKKAGSKGNTCH